MTVALIDLIAALAERRGVALPPGWRGPAAASPGSGAAEEDLPALLETLGWAPPVVLRRRPRAGQFPLLGWDPMRGWMIVERFGDGDTILVSIGDGTGVRPAVAITTYAQIAFPGGGTRDRGERRALAIVRRAMAAQRSVLAAAMLATVIVNLIALVTSLYSMQVYDRVIPRGGFATLWVLTAGALFALMLDFALKTARALMIEREAARVDAEVADIFFARMQAIRLDARPAGVGTLAAQLRGWEQVRGLISSAFLFLMTDLPFALFFIVVIAALGGEIALVPLISFPIALGAALIFARAIRAATARVMIGSNQKSGLLVEAIDAAETVKANRGGWHLLSRWATLHGQVQAAEDPVKRWTAIAQSIFGTLQQLTYVLLIAWGAVRVAEGAMTTGALVACSILAGRVTGPLVAQLPALLLQGSYARSSLAALDSLLSLPADDDPATATLRPERIVPSLELDGVAFAYSGARPTLEIEGLRVAAGEKVAVIGGIGAGKTTLLRLMAGLYAPRAGLVRLGALDIAQLAPDVLRRDLGYVPQNARLLNGTLRENLLLGLDPPSDDRLMGVLTEVGLAPVVAAHPRGLDLPIAEGGRGLSGGQRTLVGLARLLLADQPLWLLDEPTADLDQATEAAVLKALSERLTPDRTLVLVTHRLQLLPLVDRIVVMAGGKVALDGPAGQVVQTLQARAKSDAARPPAVVTGT